MKKQISICIILSILVIILALLYIKQNNESSRHYSQNNTESEKESENSSDALTSSNHYETYSFCAKSEDGRVTVYDLKSQTLYMETAIVTDLLPDNVKNELETGIYFKTEAELFDFLESYSS